MSVIWPTGRIKCLAEVIALATSKWLFFFQSLWNFTRCNQEIQGKTSREQRLIPGFFHHQPEEEWPQSDTMASSQLKEHISPASEPSTFCSDPQFAQAANRHRACPHCVKALFLMQIFYLLSSFYKMKFLLCFSAVFVFHSYPQHNFKKAEPWVKTLNKNNFVTSQKIQQRQNKIWEKYKENESLHFGPGSQDPLSTGSQFLMRVIFTKCTDGSAATPHTRIWGFKTL